MVEPPGLAVDGADPGSGEGAVRSSQRVQIERVVGAGFAGPSFDVASVARGTGLASGRIRSILAADGTTVARLVRKRRVAEALRLSTTRDPFTWPEDGIALAVGHADVKPFLRDPDRIASASDGVIAGRPPSATDDPRAGPPLGARPPPFARRRSSASVPIMRAIFRKCRNAHVTDKRGSVPSCA